jgi:phosphoglycolate phosphatase
MIGDTTYDGLLAKNAGVEFIGVAWGFHEKRELSEAGAGHVAADTEDLSRIVSNSI